MFSVEKELNYTKSSLSSGVSCGMQVPHFRSELGEQKLKHRRRAANTGCLGGGL